MADTLPGLLAALAARAPRGVALRQKRLGIWQEVTWGSYLERVRNMALGMADLGLRPGEVVALIGGHRMQWLVAELGVQAAGGIVAPLYAGATLDELAGLLARTGARFAAVEGQEQVDILREVRDRLPALERVLYWDPRGMRTYTDSWLQPLWEVTGEAPPATRQGSASLSPGPSPTRGGGTRSAHAGAHDFDAMIAALTPESVAAIIFSPGEAEAPRGARLTHANLIAAARGLVGAEGLSGGRTEGSPLQGVLRRLRLGGTAASGFMSFTPNAWIGDRAFATAGALVAGYTVNLPEEPETVAADIQEVGPELIAAPPRVWQQLEAGARGRIEGAGRVRRALARGLLGAGSAPHVAWPLAVPLILAVLALVCAVLVLLGSGEVWATVPERPADWFGIEGDGWISQIAGLIAIIAAVARLVQLVGSRSANGSSRLARLVPRTSLWPSWLMLAMFGIAFLTGLINQINPDRIVGELDTDETVSLAAGLSMVTWGALAGLILSFVQMPLREAFLARPIRDHLGLLHAHHVYCAGAPLPEQTARFFHAIGVPLKSLYSLTAAAGPVALGEDNHLRALPGVELETAIDGEVLVRAPGVAVAYQQDPAPVASQDGRLHTGDAGRIEPDGSLTLLDRVRDIVRLRDGSEVMPATIVRRLAASPFVRDAVVIANGRPYVAALIALDGPAARAWGERHGLTVTTYEELSRHPGVAALIRDAVQQANATLPERLAVQRFAILSEELSADEGELTPLGMVRRSVVLRRYSGLVEILYGNATVADVAPTIVAVGSPAVAGV